MIAIAPGQQALRLPERVHAVEAWIDGQLIDMKSPARGKIARVCVANGDFVHRGDVLVELEPRVGPKGNAIATEIRASVAGRIVDLSVARGDAVARRDPVATILFRNELWVLARFDAREFARLRVGQYARVRTETRALLGRIGGLMGALDPVLLDLVGGSARAPRPGTPAAVAVEVD